MILVGMCSSENIKALTNLSLMELLGRESDKVVYSNQIGGYKPHGMNNLVRDAREVGATHLLNIDSDMTFPPDALERLLKADRDIVGAAYNQRGNHLDQGAPTTTVKFLGENGYKAVQPGDFPTELFECGAVGLGLTLINMRVFDSLPFPWFHTTETMEEHSTEDIVFCKEAREKGFEVWCDPTLLMGHIGSYIY